MARKPSSDPVQEKLRQDKALWNKDVSIFINDLIHLKKTMNGWPSKFHNEKSFIKDPIPADPSSILGVLSGDFQDLTQKGNNIIEEQIQYSKNRRKRQPKQLNLPLGESPPKNDLSQQLSLPHTAATALNLIKIASDFESKYLIEKEASNVLTRFFTRLFNPTIGFGKASDIRRARIAMLDSAANAFKGLEKFQVMVVKKSEESVHEAKRKLDEIWNQWTLVARAYVIYKNSESTKLLDKGGTIESQVKKMNETEEKAIEHGKLPESKNIMISPTDEDLENPSVDNPPIIAPVKNTLPEVQEKTFSNDPILRLEYAKLMTTDYKKNLPILASYLNELNESSYKDFDAAVDKFIITKGKDINLQMPYYYNNTLKILNDKNGTNGSSFKEIANQLKNRARQQLKNQTTPNPEPLIENISKKLPVDNNGLKKTTTMIFQIEKVAQDFLKKWFGKTRHQLSVFDKTSTNRLYCYKLADEIRVDINKVMDSLERDLNEEELDPLIKEINSKITSLRGLMRSLHMSLPITKKNK